MSITKSYNKYTDTYYAYDTTYVWDEKSQRKVQKKVCIGQYDRKTGKIIPNAKRGRPSKQIDVSGTKKEAAHNNTNITQKLIEELSSTIVEMNEIEASIATLEERFNKLKKRLSSLSKSVSENQLSKKSIGK